jgi:hypothetical protein
MQKTHSGPASKVNSHHKYPKTPQKPPKSKKHQNTTKKSKNPTPSRSFSNYPSESSITEQIPDIRLCNEDTPRVAIIGGGASAMYTAKYILQANDHTHVHIIDSLHTPYGLVRNGIAPDHPEAKNVVTDFQNNVLGNKRVAFIGGVKIKEVEHEKYAQKNAQNSAQNSNDAEITLNDLYQHYHAVVIATGASTGKKLGIKGSAFEIKPKKSQTRTDSLTTTHPSPIMVPPKNLYDSHDFVSWYNGHPDYSTLNPPLDATENVIIVGNGNVSLDLARILLSPIPMLLNSGQNESAKIGGYHYLRNTDIPVSVRDVLVKSKVKNVFVCARRGVMDAAYTIAELREILTLTTKKWPEAIQSGGDLEENDGNDGNEQNEKDNEQSDEKSYKLQMINIDLTDDDKAFMSKNRAVNRKTSLLLEHSNLEGISSIVNINDDNSFEQFQKSQILFEKLQKTDQKLQKSPKFPQKSLSFVFQSNPSEVLTTSENDDTLPTATGMVFNAMEKSIVNGKTAYKETKRQFALPYPLSSYQDPSRTSPSQSNTMIITSIGYQTIGLDGVSFDSKRNIYPTEKGRLLVRKNPEKNKPDQIRTLTDGTVQSLADPDTYPSSLRVDNGDDDRNNPHVHLKNAGFDIVPFVYSTGWARRGPIGILGTNIGDAKETATSVIEDLENWSGMGANHGGNDGKLVKGKSTFEKLPKIKKPSELWSKHKFFATSQKGWGSIQLYEQSKAHCLGVKAWIEAENDEKSGDKNQHGGVQSVFDLEHLASVKENDWDVIRKASIGEM